MHTNVAYVLFQAKLQMYVCSASSVAGARFYGYWSIGDTLEVMLGDLKMIKLLLSTPDRHMMNNQYIHMCEIR